MGVRVAGLKSSAVPSSRSQDLLRGGSALIDLGLVSCRAASAMHKLEHDSPLDEIDTQSLSKIRDLLQASAESVEFFASGGQSGNLPADALVPQIDAAIGVAQIESLIGDGDELSMSLQALAASFEEVVNGVHAEIADVMSQFLKQLSESVLMDTASTGEFVARL